jgi:hypothetical protein
MVVAVNRSANSEGDAIAPIGEKRITLRNLDWQAYQQLRSILEERNRVRLTYDRGTLEMIVSGAVRSLAMGVPLRSLKRRPHSLQRYV